LNNLDPNKLKSAWFETYFIVVSIK